MEKASFGINHKQLPPFTVMAIRDGSASSKILVHEGHIIDLSDGSHVRMEMNGRFMRSAWDADAETLEITLPRSYVYVLLHHEDVMDYNKDPVVEGQEPLADPSNYPNLNNPIPIRRAEIILSESRLNRHGRWEFEKTYILIAIVDKIDGLLKIDQKINSNFSYLVQGKWDPLFDIAFRPFINPAFRQSLLDPPVEYQIVEDMEVFTNEDNSVTFKMVTLGLNIVDAESGSVQFRKLSRETNSLTVTSEGVVSHSNGIIMT